MLGYLSSSVAKACEDGFDDIVTLLVKHKIGIPNTFFNQPDLLQFAALKNNAILLKLALEIPVTNQTRYNHRVAYQIAYDRDHFAVLDVLKSWYAAHNIPLPV
jgi:hypothetical protein